MRMDPDSFSKLDPDPHSLNPLRPQNFLFSNHEQTFFLHAFFVNLEFKFVRIRSLFATEIIEFLIFVYNGVS
jgi:hypothetical protein